ncbi:response regulator transcription factor [Solirubrobacter soli]|uniref:response regulator transcription factor n=1 Tax=Solirubrobacter soli TaxID=363832 RepID=UPI00041F82F9|nr:response regulator transcription factor [Solirubrobacter soli]
MRVLLVDDDAKLAQALAKGLRRHAYAVDVAGDADGALLRAAVYEYDVVLLDVMLPGGDGFKVCRSLRERGDAVPVLMLTARDAVHDRIRGLDAGADDYLPKPFDFGELLARMRALLRRGPTQRESALRTGPLVVDPATRVVTLHDRVVDLTAREFAVLEYLARHPGEVVTRTALIEHVWDENFDGSTNVVDVYIGYLRRKLGAPLIATVRGVGFRLETA